MDPERARQRLAEERARIEQELERIGRPEASDEPQDSGDQADELEQEATDDALREDLKQNLEGIERAEARLEEGTYGKSVISGEPIPDERLERFPGPTGWSRKSPAAAARRSGLRAADQQVVEELRRQVRLEHLVVQSLQRKVAAEGEAPPSPTAPGRLGARLQGPHGPAVDRGEQLLTADPDVVQARGGAEAPQVAGGEGVDVDLGLEASARCSRPPASWSRCEAPHRPPPERRRSSAVRFGIAARKSPYRDGSPQKASVPPGRSTRANSEKALARSGMWWRTAWPKTRSKLSSGKGSVSASAAAVLTSRPRRDAFSSRVASIPGEMSVAVARSIAPGLQQIEREVAGPGTDLQRVAERPGRASRPSALRSLPRHLLLADVAEVDPPLGVVGGRRHVVIALVDLLDPLWASGGGTGRDRSYRSVGEVATCRTSRSPAARGRSAPPPITRITPMQTRILSTTQPSMIRERRPTIT